ncbi:hypothetical protein HAHE_31360 [Haloferula helveola]|uniref:DUF4381 domain-containing protein n=1 Tax=Haloferula helveola TaxID=490095 RepID=A0ABM7RIG0_9BACT|nr:hypothetical protein HAHE_31360 [Haloferula helveola]
MEDDPLQLRDVVPADTLVSHPGLPWWGWLLIAVGAVLVTVAVVFLIRRKPATAGMQIPVDREAAYRLAQEQIQSSAELPLHEAATRISGALRLYLAKIFRDPSLYETHEEFLARHEALDDLPEITREQVSTLLCRLAQMKYDQPRTSPGEVATDQPLSVLRQIHQQAPA